MSDFDDDEDMARAIAASLADSQQPRAPAPAADDYEAQYEADLQAALAASQAVAEPHRSPSPATSVASSIEDSPPRPNGLLPTSSGSRAPKPKSAPDPAAGSSSGGDELAAFRADRKRLEEERLARQKRRRDESGQPEEIEDRRPAKRATPSSASASSSSSPRVPLKPTPGPSRPNTELFWDGVVRQTANMHVGPGKNGENGKPVFRLSEIIGDKSQVKFAIISSYAVQVSWIYNFFSPTTPVILVAQPDQSEASSATVKLNILPHWVRVTPYFRGGYGVMHVKFLLLFYADRLRIAIPTANFVDYDWMHIENTVFVQDVPLRASPIAHSAKLDDFPTTLEHVLRGLNVSAGIRTHVMNDHPEIPLQNADPGSIRRYWDFSRVTAALIPSLHGKHEGWEKVIKTGHTALMRAVRRLAGIDPKDKRGRKGSIEYQGSSLGKYSSKWLNEFYGSAMGQSPETWLDDPVSRRSKLPVPDIKIVFPTHDYVKNSKLGEPGGGTIFCKKAFWEGSTFPRQIFYESRSTRGPVLLHSKMAIAFFSDIPSSASNADDSDDELIVLDSDGRAPAKAGQAEGWMYVGSHNFTPSAWGTLSGSAFTPIINVTNYELGVVLPLRSREEADAYACYERPPKKYANGVLPWMQENSIHHQIG
ncbi:unnamed protein product [Peniophora sp. CBMAI 1063]|nr:unnamed protein product [Peniophora sp. CBMAI 1063]